MGRGQSSYNPGSVLNPYGGRGGVNNMPVNPIPGLGDLAGQFPRPGPQYPGMSQPMPAPIGPGSKSGMGGQPAGPFTGMPQMGSIPGLPRTVADALHPGPGGSTPGLPPMMGSLPNVPQMGGGGNYDEGALERFGPQMPRLGNVGVTPRTRPVQGVTGMPQMGSLPGGFRQLSQMGSIPGTREADRNNQFNNLVNELGSRDPNFAMNNALRGLGQGAGLSNVARGIERDSLMRSMNFNSPSLNTMRYGNRPQSAPRYGHGGQMMPQYGHGGQMGMGLGRFRP